MLPAVSDFTVMESEATIVAGGVTYPVCTVIYLPPENVSASDLDVDTSPSVVVNNQPRIDVRKDQVPALLVGSQITGSMDGMPSRTYRVNRVESRDPQWHHAWVS